MSKKARQEKARAAMQEAQKDELRTRRLTIIGISVVVVLILGIITIGVMFKSSGSTLATPGVNPDAPLPTGVMAADSDYPYGWAPLGVDSDKNTLEVWEDFQCPACAALENSAAGDNVDNLKDKNVSVIYRPVAFLDNNLGNTSSTDAMNAFGCAIDAGIGEEYHNTVFNNQPEEGVGYTETDLLSFADLAGLPEDKKATFTTCVQDGTYDQWAANATATFIKANAPGSPWLLLNGQELPGEVAFDPAALNAAIDQANGTSSTPTPEPAVSEN